MKLKNILTTSLVVSLGITAIGAPAYATASSTQESAVNTTSADVAGFSGQELDELAGQIETLFTEVLIEQSDGTYLVDEEAALDSFGEETGQAVIQEFRSAALANSFGVAGGGVAAQAGYGQCVLNFVGFGTLFGTAEGSISSAIDKKNWDLAAREIAKVVGKSAIRGGVVGLAASLAAGGAWCATPWS